MRRPFVVNHRPDPAHPTLAFDARLVPPSPRAP
jgi:hypothetical protein